MTATEHVAVWLVEHPKLRRALTVMASMYGLCLCSVVAAPRAAADVGAAAIGWTGLRDTDGVPLQCYFLSVVDTSEAITNNGQQLSVTDPSTWVSWMVKSTQTAVTHSTVAWWLTNEVAALVFLIGLALWFLRFAMSSSWLLALAQVGRPVFAAVNKLVNQMWLGPLALALCVTVAGFHYNNGRPARAWNLLGTAAILSVLLWTVFKDPIDDMVSDHGLLGIGRATGFQIAQAARNGSYAPGQSLQAQLDALLAQLVSATARPAVQLQNFGTVVDDVGTCRHAWSQAIIAGHGQGPGPAHAMAHCGAPQALAHAQQLGANDFVLGLFFLGIGFSISLFIWYVGISTLLVGAKATYYAIVVGPAILLGMTGWKSAKSYAIRAGSQMFLHAAEMIIYTTFLAITSVGMGWALTTPTLGHGGTTVVPRMLMVGLGAIVAMLLFHYIDKHFYTDSLGTIGHHINGAWQSGRAAAQAEYDDFSDGVERARRGRDRYRQWRSRHASDENNDSDDDLQTPDSTAGFEIVKPRPTGHGQPGGHIASHPSPASDQQVTTVLGRAATAAEGSEVVGAAEGAASAAAPEVAVAVAAVTAATRHVRNHHTSPDTAPHTAAPAQVPSRAAQPLQWADRDSGAEEGGSLPALPRRASSDGQRRAGEMTSSRSSDAQPHPGQSPGADHGENPTDDPALEFPPTPPARPVGPPRAKDDRP
uniref:TrbL/VirB6 plasmid conjugal transfer protein n=1 Tax=Mycobacterium riyadhense TaxID=486698 RepID=A0A653F271_9MYCO|nr:hypothetical protein BIN_B_05279 [Mycobacterium riyadhense]